MESAFDIDLSGDGDQLPPGVQAAVLGGTAEPAEPPTPVEPSAEEVEEARQLAEEDGVNPLGADLDADFAAALEGDDDFDGAEQGYSTPGERGKPEPEESGAEQDAKPSQENPTPAGDASPIDLDAPENASIRSQVAPPTKPPKRTGRKKAASKKPTQESGSVARRYLIFERVQSEVDGQIVDVYVRRAFQGDGEVIEAIKARNRDLALNKAGKLFGHGFEGTLVAVPEGMWDEKTVRNKPREVFRVEVG